MIKTKEDLEFYLECDKVSLGINRKKPYFFGDEIWKYEIRLRKYEYYKNTNSKSPLRYLNSFIFNRLSLKTGFQISANTCGPGLSLAHIGTVIVNSHSRVGENCRIQTGVTLGSTNGSNNAPELGNNIFLSEGAKLIGNISIADDVQIGANAVVVKSIYEKGTTWAGVPAKKISDNSSELNIIKATEIVKKRRKR